MRDEVCLMPLVSVPLAPISEPARKAKDDAKMKEVNASHRGEVGLRGPFHWYAGKCQNEKDTSSPTAETVPLVPPYPLRPGSPQLLAGGCADLSCGQSVRVLAQPAGDRG